MADEQPLELTDDPYAPEIFATGISGYLNLKGTIAVTLEAVKSDYSTEPGTIRRFVVGRLVLTPAAAQGLAITLNDFLRTQGLDPSEAFRGGQTAQ